MEIDTNSQKNIPPNITIHHIPSPDALPPGPTNPNLFRVQDKIMHVERLNAEISVDSRGKNRGPKANNSKTDEKKEEERKKKEEEKKKKEADKLTKEKEKKDREEAEKKMKEDKE